MTQQHPAVDTNLPSQPPDALPPAKQPSRDTFDAAGTIDTAAFRALNSRFRENRDQFPAEQLAAYAGQWVAWWPDGTRIFDADVSLGALDQRLDNSGYVRCFFPLEKISPPGAPIDPLIAMHMRFRENRDNAPAELLEAYAGKYVAWWPDGTRIIDADDNARALIQRLRANGYKSLEYIVEQIIYPEESIV